MSKTYEAEFDATVLPAWAQKQPAVVRLCERNLSYRCDVLRYKSAAWKRRLAVQAEAAVSRERSRLA